jgi:hypothetical protein
MARPSEGEELMLVIRIAVSEWGAAPAGPNRGRRAGQGYPPSGPSLERVCHGRSDGAPLQTHPHLPLSI